MKKLLLSIAIVATGFAAFAQKPAAGNITTEIGLSSLLGTPANPATTNLPIGMFRVRYFLNEGMAVRVHLGFGNSSTTTKQDNAPATPVITAEKKVSATSFGLAVGIEKHLAGTDKLSPYVGAEFGFGSVSGSTEITNSNNAAGTPSATGDKYNVTGGGTTTIALNGLIGADYYITEKVYFGAEMGIGLFMSSSAADTKVESTTGGVTTSVTAPGPSTSSLGLMPNVLGQIRLGIIIM